MNFPFFIVKKTAFSKEQSFSRFIIKIAIAAVALSMTVMIIATSLINGFQETISEKVFGFWAHIIVTPFESVTALEDVPVSTNEHIYANFEEYEDLKSIQVTALKGGIMHTTTDFEGVVLKGIGKDFDWEYFQKYIEEGNRFEPTGSNSNQDMLISKITANRLFLEVGDKVVVSFFDEKSRVRKRNFTVKGIYNSGIEEFDEKYAVIDIGVIQGLNQWDGDEVGGFEIFVKDEYVFSNKLKSYMVKVFGGLMDAETKMEPLDRVGDNLYYELGNHLHSQTIKEFRPEIFNWLELQTVNEIVLLLIMILVAAFNMITALLILILERTNMIGILKAMGSNNKQIKNTFLINGAIIIITGLLIGNLLGIGVCVLQDVTHFVKLPQESYYISFAPVKIDWLWIAILNIFTLVLSTLFLLLPTILVTKINPVKAIRFD